MDLEVDHAVRAFKTSLPEFYHRCKPLLGPLLRFFVESFSVNVNPNELPCHPRREDEQQRTTRKAAVCRLMREFRQAKVTFNYHRDLHFDIFTNVIYWYLKDPGAREVFDRKERRQHQPVSQEDDHIFHARKVISIPTRRRYILAHYDPEMQQAPPEQPKGPPGDFYGKEEFGSHRPVNEYRWEEYFAQCEKLEEAQLQSEAEDIKGAIAEMVVDDEQAEPTASKPRLELSSDLIQHTGSSLQPEEAPLIVKGLGKIAHREILDRIIDVTAREHSHRYGQFLKSEIGSRVREHLEDALNPRVKKIFESEEGLEGRWFLQEEEKDELSILEALPSNPFTVGSVLRTCGEDGSRSLENQPGLTGSTAGISSLKALMLIGGSPETVAEPGVYLHILSDNTSGEVRLYVGQAMDLSARIRDHNSLQYRRRHKSLHYHAWNSSKNWESVFVELASFPGFGNQELLPYLLNLEEMWMACAFQTLQEADLEKFLPAGTPKPWVGMNLNVALPLWQSFPHEDKRIGYEGLSREDFINCFFSKDETKRLWAQTLRDSYHDLRNSPEILIRSYYLEERRRQSKEGNRVQLEQAYWNFQAYLLDGREVCVRAVGYKSEFDIGDFTIYISKKLKLPIRDGDICHAQLFLTARPNPLRYARLALETDPASRLLILLRDSKGGHGFSEWLFTNGPWAVKRMNRLVDILEGIEIEESRALQRRAFRKRDENGRQRMVET